VNVHAAARLTDQGIVTGAAAETVRLRERLGADVSILADVDVKHSAPLAERPLSEEVAELVERGWADGLVASGSGTGHATSLDHLRNVVAARDELDTDASVFVGSGVTRETVGEALDVADCVIVGTALKENEETTASVDEQRVRRLVEEARQSGRSSRTASAPRAPAAVQFCAAAAAAVSPAASAGLSPSSHA